MAVTGRIRDNEQKYFQTSKVWLFKSSSYFSVTSEELARCINLQPGGPGDFWSRFFLPLALDKSIPNCRTAVIVLVHPGILFRRYPQYLVSVPLSVTWAGARFRPYQWRNRDEWRLVSARRQQLVKNQIDR